MAQVTQLSSQGLHWVKQELGNSLRRVREFVEAYLETPANALPLQRAMVELHQIRGTLRMVQCDGAAVLAEEMKACVQDLLRELDSAPEKAFEALLGSTLQLSDYLDLVAAGESDNALIFLPIINELRVSRGAGVVSESALFVQYASLHAQQPPAPDLSGRLENGAQAVAKQRLPAFQAALLRVLKDQNTAENLRRLALITGELRNAVSNARGQRVFAAAGTMIVAMQAGDLDADLEVKRLLGRVGQQIKNAADQGDAALADVPDALLYGLIYFAGRVHSDNAQVTALRADYGLNNLLPERTKLEALRARLRAPATGLVNKLSAEIKGDIDKVKDSIDLVIRAGDKAGINLDDTASIATGIADTLGMLGLDMLKRVVDNQAQAIATLAQSKERNQDAWMDVALALIRVEQTLESALFQHMHRGFVSGDDEEIEPREDIDSGTRAIYREALVNVARVKALLPEFIDRGEPSLLIEAARLLHELQAGLQIVDQPDGVVLVSRLREFVASQAMLSARNNRATVTLLAEAISSVEYYLEALLSGYAQQPDLLQQAESTVAKLEAAPGIEQPLPEATAALEVPAATVAQASPTEGIDPDIRDTFLEEANEVLAGLQRDVPAWSNNLDNDDRLADIRRAFHTLKGSGRMVGATDIGEFGWAVEYLLNRCIEQAIPTNSAVVAVVGKAVAALPRLVEDFSADRASVLSGQVIALADKTSGRISEAQAADGLAEAQDADELLRVFRADARTHIQTVKVYSEQIGPRPVSNELVRALHTLKGSARAVDMQPISEAAAALEHFADISRMAQHPIGDAGMAVLSQACSLFYARIEALDSAAEERADADLQDLLAGVADLSARLPQSALEASSDQELLIIFTDEASDLLDEIDEGLVDWQKAPTDRRHPTQIKAVCHKLKGSARTSDAGAIASIVEALEAQIIDYLRATQTPTPEQFEVLHAVVDGVYDMLDRFRHGDRSDDPQALLAMLGAQPEAPALEFVPSSEAADNTVPEDSEDIGVDPELQRIFNTEATDLAEQIDSQIAAWTQRPEDEQPRLALMRLLHTLKGSARMTGATAIGDLAHNLETVVARAQTAPQRSEVALLENLSTQADALHRLVDDVRTPHIDAPAAQVPEADEIVPVEPVLVTEFDARLYWHPDDEADEPAEVADTARVSVEQLDTMLNQAGEISIYRARLEQKTTGLQFQLRELQQTTGRLREQLRKLDMETETQIMARHELSANRYDEEFDPLEMDRYSALHELSRGLAESATDLTSLHGSMAELVEQHEVLLTQQARVNTALQQGLMGTLMVPFANQQARLQRLVRQAGDEHKRNVRIEFSGADAELDRSVLERMTAPLEHLLRNAVIHGIETPQGRSAAGKDESGLISVALRREGTQLIIDVRDDGRGLDYARIRDTAVRRGLLRARTQVDEADLALFIFEPGFSTANELTQDAGRGVGLDVVNAQIKQLGGTMTVDSQAGSGTLFSIRLPLTLAITQALMIRVGGETYAVPIAGVEGVARVARSAVPEYLANPESGFDYGGLRYQMLSLGELLGGQGLAAPSDDDSRNLPLLLVRAGERRSALVVDAMLGSREIVVKSVGPQVSTVPGVSGATIRADGEVVLILDTAALLQLQARQVLGTQEFTPVAEVTDERPLVMVVDDSITIRRVSERFLSRSGMRVVTAKDGMDAMAKLQTNRPDVVLLDIEMPRIDGFELATYMRNSEELKSIPIIMITSRSGDKHRRRAEQIGVDRFLTKPYQEQELLQHMYAVMRANRHE